MPHVPQSAVVCLLQGITDARNIAPGDRIALRPHLVVLGPRDGLAALKAFRLAGGERVADPSRVLLFTDDNLPAPDTAAANRRKQLREAARQTGITRVIAEGGCELAHLLEQALIVPGECAVSALPEIAGVGGIGALGLRVTQLDLVGLLKGEPLRLTVPQTVRVDLVGKRLPHVGGWDLLFGIARELTRERLAGAALEIGGEGLGGIALHERTALAMQAAHAGLFSAHCLADRAAVLELNKRIVRPYAAFEPEKNTAYAHHATVDVQTVHAGLLPPGRDWRPLSEASGERIAVVAIRAGVEGLRAAAETLKTHHPAGVRCFVAPVSKGAYQAALAEGAIAHLVDAGVEIHPPGTPLGTFVTPGTPALLAGMVTGVEAWRAGIASAVAAAASGMIRHPEQVGQSGRDSKLSARNPRVE
jgi:3-isopropylmalate/(R)-2-methylmalate dehydratase large subunit